jgi:hypothetical protein
MSLLNLREITSRFHEGAGPAKRLEKLASTWKPGEVYTFDHLYQEVSPSSPEVLSLILGELTQRGLLQQFVRVESPFTGGGIRDYPSVLDVPPTIYDWRAEKQIEVGPENLRVLFKVLDVGKRPQYR